MGTSSERKGCGSGVRKGGGEETHRSCEMFVRLSLLCNSHQPDRDVSSSKPADRAEVTNQEAWQNRSAEFKVKSVKL